LVKTSQKGFNWFVGQVKISQKNIEHGAILCYTWGNLSLPSLVPWGPGAMSDKTRQLLPGDYLALHQVHLGCRSGIYHGIILDDFTVHIDTATVYNQLLYGDRVGISYPNMGFPAIAFTTSHTFSWSRFTPRRLGTVMHPACVGRLLGMHPLQDDHPGVQLCLYLGTPQLAYLKIQGEMILIYFNDFMAFNIATDNPLTQHLISGIIVVWDIMAMVFGDASRKLCD